MKIWAVKAAVVVGWLLGCVHPPPVPPAGDVKTIAQRGITRADHGDYRTAIEDFGLVLARDPTNAAITYLRGVAHDRLGDRSAAISDYDAALQLDPNLLPAYVARAAAHAARGDSAAAAADDQAARSLVRDDQVH